MKNKKIPLRKFPSWLTKKLPLGNIMSSTQETLEQNYLSTVCEEALCPNRNECWTKKTATYLALGKECSRKCGFCNIAYNKQPPPPNPEEPFLIAQSVITLNLKHVVITMVSRDDLPDGGASHIAKIISTIRQKKPKTTIEVLTSDFLGNKEALYTVLKCQPEIFNYNIETVRSLTPLVRHKATYERSLQILKMASEYSPNILIKSGLMVGLGEREIEVRQTLNDLSAHNVNIVTIGQYLQPNRLKIPVKKFISPEEFAAYQEYGIKLGLFMHVGPFIRSSYNAEETLTNIKHQLS